MVKESARDTMGHVTIFIGLPIRSLSEIYCDSGIEVRLVKTTAASISMDLSALFIAQNVSSRNARNDRLGGGGV